MGAFGRATEGLEYVCLYIRTMGSEERTASVREEILISRRPRCGGRERLEPRWKAEQVRDQRGTPNPLRPEGGDQDGGGTGELEGLQWEAAVWSLGGPSRFLCGPR